MNLWKGLTPVLMLLLWAGPARAQELSPELQQRLLYFQNKTPASWTEKDFADIEGVVLEMSREVLAGGLEDAEKARLRNVKITVVEVEGGPPAWIEDGSIRISEDALTQAWGLGMCLGHDIFVQTGFDLELPGPLLTRPYSVRAVLPLFPSLREVVLWLSGPPAELVKCPTDNMTCRAPQAAAIVVGTIGFLIAHEMSHILLGHQPAGKDARPIEEELAADRKAWSILQWVAPDPTDDDENVGHLIRVGMEAGPLLLLRWLRDVAADTSSETEAAEARIDHLTSKVSESVSVDVFGIVDPEPVVGRLRSIAIGWSEMPDELYVNGVRLPPQEVAGKVLRVFGKVQVFARRGDRFAYAELRTVPGSQPEQVLLTYRSLAPEPLTSFQLRDLRRRRDWFEILLGTATPSLKHRAGVPVRAPYEALHRLGLGDLIDPGPGNIPPEDKAMLEYWHDRSQPLATWRPPRPSRR